MSRQGPGTSADTLALYDALPTAVPGVERKWVAMPYTSVNGHRFRFFTRGGRRNRVDYPAQGRDRLARASVPHRQWLAA